MTPTQNKNRSALKAWNNIERRYRELHEITEGTAHAEELRVIREALAHAHGGRDSDPVAEGERLEKHCKKWAEDARANLIEELTELDVDTLEEKFRHAIEEWMGETRQQPLPETEKEIDAMIKNMMEATNAD